VTATQVCPAVSLPWQSAPTVVLRFVLTVVWNVAETLTAVSAYDYHVTHSCLRKPVQNERDPLSTAVRPTSDKAG
jgi:hypothetical protein